MNCDASDDGLEIKNVRRISTVLPSSCLTSTLPVPVPPGRLPITRAINQSPPLVDGAVLNEVAIALQATDASHVKLHRHETTFKESPQFQGPSVLQQLEDVHPDAFRHVPSTKATGAKQQAPRAAQHEATNVHEQTRATPAKPPKQSKTRVSLKQISQLSLQDRMQPIPSGFQPGDGDLLLGHSRDAKAANRNDNQVGTIEVIGKLRQRLLHTLKEAQQESETPGILHLSATCKDTLHAVIRDARQKLDRLPIDASLPGVPTAELSELFGELHAVITFARGELMDITHTFESENGACVRMAFEAALVLLKCVSSSSCSRHLVQEEMLESVSELIQHNVLSNLAAFFCSEMREKYRRDLELDTPDLKNLGKSGQEIASGVVNMLGLLVTLSRTVSIKTQRLLPLVMAATEVLNIEKLKVMHAQIIDFLVSVFQSHYVSYDNKGSLMKLDVSMLKRVLSCLESRCSDFVKHRKYLPIVGGYEVQPCTLLLLQLVQTSVLLPVMGADGSTVKSAFKPAEKISLAIWSILLANLGSAQSDKLETGRNLKGFLISLTEEMALLASAPEWPAAQALLSNLILVYIHKHREIMDRRSKPRSGPAIASKQDTVALELIIDLSGIMAFHVLPMCQPSEDDRCLLVRLATHCQASTNGQAVMQEDAQVDMQMIKDHEEMVKHMLMTWIHYDANLTSSQARPIAQFAAAQYLANRVTAITRMRTPSAHGLPQSADLESEDELVKALEDCSNLLHLQSPSMEVSKLIQAVKLSRPQAVSLNSILQCSSSLSTTVPLLLSVITQSSSLEKQILKKVRAKAMKALSLVIEVQPELLEREAVSKCLQTALFSDLEDSASVKDAALTILATHLKLNAHIATNYYDMVHKLTRDNAVTVRKRAVDTIWTCYINSETSERRVDTFISQLSVVSDLELSVQNKVIDLFKARWFNSSNSASAHTAAAEFASVMGSLGRRMKAGLTLPLPGDFALLKLLSAVLATDSKQTKVEKEHRIQAGRNLAEALLEAVVHSDENTGLGEDSSQPSSAPTISSHSAVLALLALAQANIKLLIPACNGSSSGLADPRQFLDTLRVYLKTAQSTTDESRQNTADHITTQQLQGVLLLVSMLLKELSHLGKALPQESLTEITDDLMKIIKTNPNAAVLMNACECGAAVAALSSGVSSYIVSWCSRLYSSITAAAIHLTPQPDRALSRVETQHLQLFGRNLHLLSHMLRYLSGQEELEEALVPIFQVPSAQDSINGQSPVVQAVPMVSGLLSLVTQLPLFTRSSRDRMLSALGQLLVGHPDVVMQSSGTVLHILKGALGLKQSPVLLHKVLNILIEMIRSEEAARLLMIAPKEETSPEDAIDAASADLQDVNGLGEAAAFSSMIIRELWDDIQQAATYTGQSGPGENRVSAETIRMDVLVLTALVSREGQTAPWLYYPSLIALATDEEPQIRRKALDTLKQCAIKQDDFLLDKLPDGLMLACQLHEKFAAAKARVTGRDVHGWNTVCSIISGGLYPELIAPDKRMKSKFFASLTKQFDTATNCKATQNNHITPRKLRRLEFVVSLLAVVPYGIRDDLLMVLHKLTYWISQRGDALKDDILESFEGSVARPDAAVGVSPVALSGHASECNTPTPPTTSTPPSTPVAKEVHTIRQERRACVGMTMLLALKAYLKQTYGIKSDVIAAFNPATNKGDASVMVHKLDPSARFALDAVVDVNAAEDADTMRQHFNSYQQLLEDDAADTCTLSVVIDGKLTTKRRRNSICQGGLARRASIGGNGTKKVVKKQKRRQSMPTHREISDGDADDDGDEGNYTPRAKRHAH